LSQERLGFSQNNYKSDSLLFKERLKMKRSYPVGAGMIVFRTFDDGVKVLALNNFDGTLDLPKGRLDPGESVFECAVRETFEEAGISLVDFEWGQDLCIEMENLTFYMCSTDQDPVIRPNPAHGYCEHDSAVWIDPYAAYKQLPTFLKPALKWAVAHLVL